MQKTIHIGKLIKAKMQEDRRSVSWLAEKLHCDPSNIHRIFKHPHIHSEQLLKISGILDCDFFEIYSIYLLENKEKTNKNGETLHDLWQKLQ
jgi:plasmid maintenance system antidote protein VapI